MVTKRLTLIQQHCPTPVGMNRRTCNTCTNRGSVPHTRGDEPIRIPRHRDRSFRLIVTVFRRLSESAVTMPQNTQSVRKLFACGYYRHEDDKASIRASASLTLYFSFNLFSPSSINAWISISVCSNWCWTKSKSALFISTPLEWA
jgi:hypothetical protein